VDRLARGVLARDPRRPRKVGAHRKSLRGTGGTDEIGVGAMSSALPDSRSLNLFTADPGFAKAEVS